MERHRLLLLYLKKRTNHFPSPLRLLHFAPEPMLQRLFSELPNLDYITADYAPGAGLRTDITHLAVADRSIDVILCLHVLEHIPNDRLAMTELRRVLRPDGWAILQVPIDPSREKTYEDPTITSPEGRLAHFGQEDHVRWFGRDYAERLRGAGFRVVVDDLVRTLPLEHVRRYGLSPEEDIYLCHRS